jgi:hypothetical protein
VKKRMFPILESIYRKRLGYQEEKPALQEKPDMKDS